MTLSPERFEALVAEALDALPKRYRDLLEDVAVVIEDRSAPELRQRLTLGRYHGVPRLIRQGVDPLLPDHITLFRDDLLQVANSEAELRKEIEATLWHEIGHHLGFSDAELLRLERKKR